MLHFILNKENPPLGEVEEYYWRKEYQMRGAPHIHMILWVKGAPKFGKDRSEVILSFIEQYITCDIPKESENEQLRELVLQFQQHNCSKYCHRKFKSKEKVYTKCRFGFPRPTHSTGHVNDFMSAVRHKVTRKSPKNTYYLRRGAESKFINDYSAVLLLMWKANIDVQFVADEGQAIARYVTGYITKAEKSQADNLWSNLSSVKTVKENLFTAGVQVLQQRLCSSQETSDRLSGTPLIGRSVSVLWLSVGPAATRKRVLKSVNKIKELAEDDPDCRDIIKSNMIDTYYPDRCDSMEDMCLFEVAEHYQFRNMQPDVKKKKCPLQTNRGCLAYHKKPRLINHFRFTMDTEEKKEKFYFCLLQLFKPWRAEEELLGGCSSYEEAFNAAKDSLSCEKMERYMVKLVEDSERKRKIDEEIAKTTPESSQTSLIGSQLLLGEAQVFTDVEIAMQEVQGAMERVNAADLDVDSIEASLNKGQQEIYQKIVHEIERSFAHKEGLCKCKENHQVLMYVSGEAGTGKSYLICALRAYMLKKTGDAKSCAVAAPTGLAAHNVNGVTLHRLLMLPVEQDSRMIYKELSAESAQAIARVMRKVNLLIIDEISMVSNLMLAFVHLRLMEALRTAPNIPFGNKHVIVFGDLLQLTPVKGQPVFKVLSSKDANIAIGSIGNVNLWRYFKYCELTENMRQAEDLEYSKMLQGIRVGIVTDDVKTILETRLVERLLSPGSTEYDLMTDLLASGANTVALMCTIAECNEFNTKMIHKENSEIVTMESRDILEAATMPQAVNQTVEKRLKEMEKNKVTLLDWKGI